MLGEHGLEGAEAFGRLNVADGAHNDHGRRLDDGHRLDGLLLVELGAELVHLAHNMGHARLVADEGGQVDGLGRIVLGKGLALASVTARALLGQKAQRAVSWVLEFTMTLKYLSYQAINTAIKWDSNLNYIYHFSSFFGWVLRFSLLIYVN